MSDNIILHDAEDTEPAPEETVEAEEWYPEVTDFDFIAAACNAMGAVDSYDAYMESDKKRVKRIQRRCLLILDICTKNVYDLLTEVQEEDQESS
jgi:hypothetical protein